MKKLLLCLLLCLLVPLCASAELYESIEIADVYYAFTSSDGTRTVTDLTGLSLKAQAALHENNALAGELTVKIPGENALRILLSMDENGALAQINNTDGVLSVPAALVYQMDAPDIVTVLKGMQFPVTRTGENTYTVTEGVTLQTMEGSAFVIAWDSGATFACNVEDNGCGIAEYTDESGTIRYEAALDEEYPDMVRGTIMKTDNQGKLCVSPYACFGPEETESGLATTVYFASDAANGYAELGESAFFVSVQPADGSLWTIRSSNGNVDIAVEKNGCRDYIRAQIVVETDSDAEKLPMPDFSALKTIEADDPLFADVGLGLMAKLEKYPALENLLRQWNIME